jgi:hypothetical protein
MENNWFQQISEKIDHQSQEHISLKDFRFYQIDKLKRIAKFLEQNSNCLDCKYAKIELDLIVDDLDRLINKSGVNRSEYENRTEKILTHLKKNHGVYQAFHFSYTYAAIYTLIGIVFGLLLSYGLFFGFNPTIFFLASGVGMMVGYILGNRKDRFCKRNGKQL